MPTPPHHDAHHRIHTVSNVSFAGPHHFADSSSVEAPGRGSLEPHQARAPQPAPPHTEPQERTARVTLLPRRQVPPPVGVVLHYESSSFAAWRAKVS